MTRLDLLLTDRALASSRAKAQELIRTGAVTVNGKTVLKPAFSVEETDIIAVADTEVGRYVGRGGLKLEKALSYFHKDVTGLTVLDVGASTGGFTDCLLRHGAVHVYALDSGTGQLAPSLLADARVTSLENRNARYMKREDFPENIDFAVMDVSFISQTLIHDALFRVLPLRGGLISLIKPQFEAGRKGVGKNGIVKNEKERKAAVERVLASATATGFSVVGVVDSPITGGDGNKEFLAYFVKERE